MDAGPISLLGVTVHPLTVDELHEKIEKAIVDGSHDLILNVNVHALNLAYEQPWLRRFFNMAPVVFCDGAGVIVGAKLLDYDIPERITYADWMWELADFAQGKNLSLYFLGGKPDVAEHAASKLRDRYPSLMIVGTHHGYFDKDTTCEENQYVVMDINSKQPNILVVGFGMPLQEKWLLENWDKIDANVALTGGAVFDYISGKLRRGPSWFTDNGFEWLARLLIEPRRLWRRYIIGNPKFFYRIYRQHLE